MAKAKSVREEEKGVAVLIADLLVGDPDLFRDELQQVVQVAYSRMTKGELIDEILSLIDDMIRGYTHEHDLEDILATYLPDHWSLKKLKGYLKKLEMSERD